MSNITLTVISSISIAVLLFIAFIVVKKKITKLGKTILWFFLPVYVISWALYFCAIFSNDSGIPLFMKIIQTSVVALKCFALDLNISIVSDLVKSNVVYTIALCLMWFLASLNTIYILLLAIFTGFKDSIRSKIIKKKSHYIIVLDKLEQLDAVSNLNLPSIIILNNSFELKNDARKFSCKKYCFIYNDNKKNALLAAGINTKGTIVLSLSVNEELNLAYLNILNDMIPNYNQTFINYDSFDVSKYINQNKNINIYNMEDLVARDFISKYPLYQEINPEIIDFKHAMLKDTNIRHFFLGFNKYSEQLMCTIISNYQIINDKLHLFICDDDSNKFIDQFNGKYFVNKHINDIINDPVEKKKYFDLEPSRFELNSISYEKNSYELKTQLLASKGNYNLYYIDYDNDKINFEKAIELDDFLKSFQVENYKIYVRFSKNNQFNIKELKKRNISIYGDNESILSKRIIIDQSLDLLAKNVNYYYSKMYGNASNELTVDELWDKLTLIDKNSNRSAAMNIISKLNLLGLTLSKDSNLKGISDDEYFKIYANSNLNRSLDMDDYNFNNARINLGILEHYRWNNFQIFNNIHPMKKELIFKGDKYNRRNKELKLHSNILSFKGLLDLEKYLANWDKLSQKDKTEYSQIFIKDFDLMDNLPSVIEKTGIKIVRLENLNNAKNK